MKAVSLHQPWAQLCVTRPPDPVREVYPDMPPKAMVKRIETRSWPFPPKLLGQRIAIHATQREPQMPNVGNIGEWVVFLHGSAGWHIKPKGWDGGVPLPLGAIVGSAVITASLPIVAPDEDRRTPGPAALRCDEDRLLLRPSPWFSGRCDDLSDQLPYGDFTPGRYAWIIEQAAPTTERCPWCVDWPPREATNYPCPVCCERRCDPIPTGGHQRIWEWNP